MPATLCSGRGSDAFDSHRQALRALVGQARADDYAGWSSSIA
jgi:hypothetical protein